MATKKKPKSSIETYQTYQKIKTFLKSQTFISSIGIILLAFAIFMLLAYLSFFFNGPADQSILDTTSQPELAKSDDHIENNTGPIGARIANYLINDCFGLGSLGIIIFLGILGLRLIRVRSFNLTYWFFTCFISMFWVSIFLGFISISFDIDTFMNWGGQHGYNTAEFLISQIGYPGVWLLLITFLILFAIFISKRTIIYIRKALQFEYLRKSTSDEEGNTLTHENEEKSEISEMQEEEVVNEPEPEEKKPSKFKAFFQRIFHKGNKKNTTADTTGDKSDEQVGATHHTEGAEHETADQEPLTEGEVHTFHLSDSDNQPVSNSKPVSDFEVTVAQEEELVPAARLTPEKPVVKTPDFQVEVVKSDEPYVPNLDVPYNPRLDLPKYKFPEIGLMKQYDNMEPTINMEEQKANKEKIIRTLESFSININTIRATVGPTVTLYEITPEQGVRIAKIRGLEDDIALSLSALGIRIIAPIPGKGTIGIEVPNSNPRIVSGQSIIGSKKFHESDYELPIALGKTITNEVFMVDLCKMPHILVAGATGQGKSVGLNTIITSLLYKKHPSELKFVLIDPKKVEFSIYSIIEKHFLAKLPDEEEAIITDVTKVVQTLNSVCVEMDTRYDLLKAAHARNIKEYNKKFIARELNPQNGHKFMPYIVVIIDEFGDLIMTAGKEIELPIARIAQLARAVGIHMVIATQRPTTNIITGTIKANFPARIAFRVSSMMDSRTILDRPGANQLIGRGDMLFLQGADPVRVQCAFIDTPEVERITEYIASQPGYPSAFHLPEYVGEDKGNDLSGVDMDRLDPLFEDAARLIVIHQQGSTSLIQRKFSIGFNRAGRIMDQLESARIVGPAQGSKPREVLCCDETELEQRLRSVL